MKTNYFYTLFTLTVAIAAGLIFISCGNLTKDEETTIPIEKIPATPTGLVEITHTENTITISWDSVSKATGYNIPYRGLCADCFQ